MADIYMTVKGMVSGEVKGTPRSARDGKIPVMSVSHGVSVDVDPYTHLPSPEKRNFGKITVKREVDRASPMLEQLLCTSEKLEQVILSFYRYESAGEGKDKAKEYYRITLNDAHISGIDMSGDSGGQLLETVNFIYDKIEWNHIEANILTSDQWKQK